MSRRPRPQGGLLASIVTLMTGTLLAQVVSVGFTPFLTRIFDPSEFGVLGLVNAAATVVAAVAALRYDMAVVLPKRHGEAANLLWLAFACVGTTTALSFLVVALFGAPIAVWLGSPELRDWFWAAPVIVFVTASYNVLTNWTTRRKQFQRLSISSVVASGSSASAKLAAGLAGLGVLGLVGGQIAGQLVALLILAGLVWRDDRRLLTQTASQAIAFRVAAGLSEFPKYHAPMSLVFTLSYNMPLYLIGWLFGPDEVGYWSLTVLVLSTPVFLVGNAVRQVLFERTSSLLNARRMIARLLFKSTGLLLLVAAAPALLGWFLAPWGFELLLGDEWVPAGYYARQLLLWQISVLAMMPASAAFPALRLQRIILPWQLVAILTGAIALIGGGWTGDPLVATLAYSVTMTVMNIIFIALVLWHARRADARAAGQPVI